VCDERVGNRAERRVRVGEQGRTPSQRAASGHGVTVGGRRRRTRRCTPVRLRAVARPWVAASQVIMSRNSRWVPVENLASSMRASDGGQSLLFHPVRPAVERMFRQVWAGRIFADRLGWEKCCRQEAV